MMELIGPRGANIALALSAVLLIWLVAIVIKAKRRGQPAPKKKTIILMLAVLLVPFYGFWANTAPQDADNRLTFTQGGVSSAITFELGASLTDVQAQLDAKQVTSEQNRYETRFHTLTVRNDDSSYYILVFEQEALARVDRYKDGQVNTVMGELLYE